MAALPVPEYDLQAEIAAGLEDGSLIKAMARHLMHKIGMAELAKQMVDKTTSAASRLDAVKYAAKLGDVEPKPADVRGPGTGFTLVINTPTNGQGPGGNPLLVDVTPDVPTLTFSNPGTAVRSLTDPLTTPAVDPELPPMPEGFKMPAFELSRDLIGPPLPKAPA